MSSKEQKTPEGQAPEEIIMDQHEEIEAVEPIHEAFGREFAVTGHIPEGEPGHGAGQSIVETAAFCSNRLTSLAFTGFFTVTLKSIAVTFMVEREAEAKKARQLKKKQAYKPDPQEYLNKE